MRTFFEALRDRLIVSFEVRNLTHKPKLVAVTSAGRGSGVSTIAAGLAACLSETGDGNVLLVDMNLEHGAAQQFYQGRAACGLDEALDTKDSALIQDNLYMATEGSNGDKLPRLLPKRFTRLVPKLKASDYDYIILDMPPISQTSITPRLASFMDMVLLVIESEKTDREIIQQASELLAESKANVSAVLNKTRTYVPARLHQEYLSDV
jgi:Mrp family chromosome partitioning ATPase